MSNHRSDADDEDSSNFSSNPTFAEVLEANLSRRRVLGGGMGVAATAMFGMWARDARADQGCDDDRCKKAALGFEPVAKSLADALIVPAGYSVQVLFALGDPIDGGTPGWSDAGTETGASFEFRAGDHHDGLFFFGSNRAGRFDENSSKRGVLCVNHENITQRYLHPAGATTVGGVRTVPDEVVKELNAHGVALIEIARSSRRGPFEVLRTSPFNRRITANSPVEIGGPVRGSSFLKTKYSADGTSGRGTVNNCANGHTPWGTYLTCEENWAGYFARAAGDNALRTAAEVKSLNRYGRAENTNGSYRWNTAGTDELFARWNTSVTGATPTDDYRNEINTFGWVVEIDPFDPAARPRKRTALGRFAHEGCWPAPIKVGKPLVFYSGDDSRGEYIYKFVSDARYNPSHRGLSAGDRYLDSGKLYVAKFNADGSGEWIELSYGKTLPNGKVLDATNPDYPFASQADVLVNVRLAADSAGATKMDRPEWGAVNPCNGEVYMTLTNNSQRVAATRDAANPRVYTDLKNGVAQNGNVNGHIIRWREAGDDPTATSFLWDIFLFGAQEDADPATVNLSELDSTNDLSSPDGLWFDDRGLLWIQTDDGAYTDVTNCMMLAAVPGKVGDGAAVTVDGQLTFKGKNLGTELRRFLVGPKESEITGVCTTPDGRAMFVNVQHPGEETAFGSHWPGGGGTRPRSATVVITRDDGGPIGLRGRGREDD